MYVGDVVAANLAAASSHADGAFNIGTGVETNVVQLVEALGSHADGGFSAEHAPERPGEVRHIYLDTARAQGELGWQAEVGLAEGLGLTLESLR